MKNFTLREISEEWGITRRNIQGYEKAGLVNHTCKNKYGHLLYDEDAKERIVSIKRYQDIGFKIKEIHNLIDAPDCVVKEALKLQLEKLNDKKNKMEDLISMLEEWIDSI